ncbi:hypothetical protein [Cyclobacterium sp. SYSU L10401]|uniref:hypothetical protein n=1 Tax=Cyclobacterium sp. SYSU L10401 TaxID=2678657 RepID=UPI0013D1A9E5|nr:hypothetical protein [Cyclobacterium sp. SYSU L10401]
MESRKDKHVRYLYKLEKHISLAKESSKYSSDRFDILLISLSTSALVLSIGFVEKVIPTLYSVNTTLLKISWLLFVVSLISNLKSQVTGYYSNEFEIKVTKNLIREERGKQLRGNQKKMETYCRNLNKLTLILNGISLCSLLIGIIILVLFFSNNV